MVVQHLGVEKAYRRCLSLLLKAHSAGWAPAATGRTVWTLADLHARRQRVWPPLLSRTSSPTLSASLPHLPTQAWACHHLHDRTRSNPAPQKEKSQVQTGSRCGTDHPLLQIQNPCNPLAMATLTTKQDQSEQTLAGVPSPDDLMSRQQLRQIFQSAVEAVLPRPMLEKVLHFNPKENMLRVEDSEYVVNNNVYVVGAGKAVLGMARVIDDLLGQHIVQGLLSIPLNAREIFTAAGKTDLLLSPSSKISVREGAKNNLPDDNALCAAQDIYKLVSGLTATDIVIVLLSGGGSALLPYPVAPLSLQDLHKITEEMFRHGASVTDVNTVRKHLEVLKGGGLARAAMPAQVISFILSDVIGDPLHLVASGPTVKETKTPHRCLDILKRLNVTGSIPQSVLQMLESSQQQEVNVSQLRADPRGGVTATGRPASLHMDWSRVHNILVGSNAISCSAAAQRAEKDNFATHILSQELSGEARQIGTMMAKLAQYISSCYNVRAVDIKDSCLVKLEMDLAQCGVSKTHLNEINRKADEAQNCGKLLCVIAGGETTVTVKGSGKGGRNQEMVLAAGLQLHKCYGMGKDRRRPARVFFLSAGTDGQDGPTEAAGAIVDENFVVDATREGLDPEAFLENNDSNTLWTRFSSGRDLVITGLTGTNVMDIQLLIVKI